jgi:hypothetical protein
MCIHSWAWTYIYQERWTFVMGNVMPRMILFCCGKFMAGTKYWPSCMPSTCGCNLIDLSHAWLYQQIVALCRVLVPQPVVSVMVVFVICRHLCIHEIWGSYMVKISMLVFWVVTLCGLVGRYCFWETYCLQYVCIYMQVHMAFLTRRGTLTFSHTCLYFHDHCLVFTTLYNMADTWCIQSVLGLRNFTHTNFCNEVHTLHLACHMKMNFLFQKLTNKIGHMLTRMRTKNVMSPSQSLWNQGSTWVSSPYSLLWCSSCERFCCIFIAYVII